MSNITISDPMPAPEGIEEVNNQRRAALGEFVQTRDLHHRQTVARTESYEELTKFLAKHKKELPPFVQEYVEAWQEDHARIEVSFASSTAALRAAQNAISTTQNAANEIFARYANRLDEVRKKMNEPNRNHVFENSKLANLLGVLTEFAERKRKRKQAK